ncbi:DNA methyltransferase [Georhizobium sp. MAB10]|uniref:DNA methyltransferase n=1 Tax=Georhizobium sp. MAB10 TaxID=3028319 RepID=UPI00385573FD
MQRSSHDLTHEGDLVVDPYAGSGTTGAVAQRLDREALLIACAPGYVVITPQTPWNWVTAT